MINNHDLLVILLAKLRCISPAAVRTYCRANSGRDLPLTLFKYAHYSILQ